MTRCRICATRETHYLGAYAPYLDLEPFDVYDCPICGCRFVNRKGDVHETMHASAASPYARHKSMAKEISRRYEANQYSTLRKQLRQHPKNRFIIDHLATGKPSGNHLEIGCSLGYLTAYFVLGGYRILGADISHTAIENARTLFGPYFVHMEDDSLKQKESFDSIYHVGTIGCVEDPLAFTQMLLDLLKPGGRLLFNAPDVKAVLEMNAIWTNLTPPPDLITLFAENFWSERFGSVCKVSVTYNPYFHYRNALKHHDRLLNIPYMCAPSSLFMGTQTETNKLKPQAPKKRNLVVLGLCYIFSLLGIVQHYKDDFGMFVILTKKA